MEISIGMYCPSRKDIHESYLKLFGFKRQLDWARIVWIEIDNKALLPFLKAINDLPGQTYRFKTTFTKAEKEHFSWFSLSGKSTKEGPETAFRKNVEHIKTLQPISKGTRYQIIIPDRLFIAPFSLEPRQIASYSFGNELIAEPKAANSLQDLFKIGNSGFVQTFHYKTLKPIPDVFHLYVTSVFPELNHNSTFYEFNCDGEIVFRAHASLAVNYRDIPSGFHAFRTREPLCAFSNPGWIVDYEIYKRVKENDIKGLDFLPLFDSTSPEYSAYLEKIDKILSILISKADNSLI